GLTADVDDGGAPLAVPIRHGHGLGDAAGDRVLVPGVGRHVDDPHDMGHAADGQLSVSEPEGHGDESRSTTTSPSRSVRMTSAPAPSSVSITQGTGCPKPLGPTGMTASRAPVEASHPGSEVPPP